MGPTVHFVFPDAVADPARPSGGNVYDRRVAAGLRALGWTVRVHLVSGFWGRTDAAARAALGRLLSALPDGAVVLLDGLVAGDAPEAVVPEAKRLRLVVLVHAALGAGGREAAQREEAVLASAAGVVVTSEWSRGSLLRRYRLRPERVHVAHPGVDLAAVSAGTPGGARLLCVGSVTAAKGYEVLVAALARLADRAFECVCVGDLGRDTGFTIRLRRTIRETGLAGRVRLTGVLTGPDLDAQYHGSDLLVLASHAETYGMVVTEALAHGLPVLATAVGGPAEALGHAPDGTRPGLLVPPDDPLALATALAGWLDDAGQRERLRDAARRRRTTLTSWAATSRMLAAALSPAATSRPALTPVRMMG
jgi:glycosyltransferase involved in cell wall biosynthesis